MKPCENCEYGKVSYSLSGHHVECKLVDNITYKRIVACSRFLDNERKSGLMAHEQKHNFFSEEEFAI